MKEGYPDSRRLEGCPLYVFSLEYSFMAERRLCRRILNFLISQKND